MRHVRVRGSSMPMFHARRNPDDVPLPNFLDLTAPLLNPTPTGSAREADGSPAWAKAAAEASKENTITFVANRDIATSSLSDSSLQYIPSSKRSALHGIQAIHY